jgi:hypothetical protein
MSKSQLSAVLSIRTKAGARPQAAAEEVPNVLGVRGVGVEVLEEVAARLARGEGG